MSKTKKAVLFQMRDPTMKKEIQEPMEDVKRGSCLMQSMKFYLRNSLNQPTATATNIQRTQSSPTYRLASWLR